MLKVDSCVPIFFYRSHLPNMSRLINFIFFLFIYLRRPQHSHLLFISDISYTLYILDNICPFSLWLFRFVAFSVCGVLVSVRYGLWPFRFVAVSVCGRFSLRSFSFVAVLACGLFGLWPFRFWPFRFVAVMTRNLMDDLEMNERDDLGHLFNANLNFVPHFMAISEIKLE